MNFNTILSFEEACSLSIAPCPYLCSIFFPCLFVSERKVKMEKYVDKLTPLSTRTTVTYHELSRIRSRLWT